jgi:transcriptional regulator with XRE-family HTH domain
VEDLAHQAVLQPEWLRELETGQDVQLDLDRLDAIAQALGISLDQLLRDPPRHRTCEETLEEQRQQRAALFANLPGALCTLIQDDVTSVPDDLLEALAHLASTRPFATRDDWCRILSALRLSI